LLELDHPQADHHRCAGTAARRCDAATAKTEENQGAAGSLAGMLAARTGLSPVMVGRAAELAATRGLAART